MTFGKKSEMVKTYCNKCKVRINHKILVTLDSKSHDLVGRDMTIDGKIHEYFFDSADSYQIIECVGCNSKSFREVCWCSEWQDFDNPGISETLFPSPEEYLRAVKEFLEIPFHIKEIYSQTIIAFNNNLWVLSAAGIRSIIEGICKQKGIVTVDKIFINKKGIEIIRKSKDLYDKIERLNELGIITSQQKSSLHELRYLGNTALHELDVPLEDDLILGIDIIENMLQNIFEIPLKSKLLENSRIKKEKKDG
jgi:hypothetical protein